MGKSKSNYQAWLLPFEIVASSLFLFLASLYSFLLFHVLVELFTVVIALGIFVVAWPSRRYINNTFLLLIGISYLFIGMLDLIHMLAYNGMNVITGYGVNLPAQLWIAARYLEAASFIAAFLLLKSGIDRNFIKAISFRIFVSYAAVFLIIMVSTFMFDIFPLTYVEGTGMTDFKIYSEYIISLLFIGAIILLFKKRKIFDKEVVNMLSLSLILKIFSELLFREYVSTYDFSNVLGHIFRFISFLLLYKAVLEGALMKPYRFLFLDLKKSEERYRALVEFSPDAIVVHSMGKIIYLNGPAKKLFGIEKEDAAIGAELTDFFGPEYRERIRFRMKNIFSGKWQEAPTTEMEILHANGRMVPVEVKGMKIVYEGKDAIESIIRDVSERKEAEKKLLEVQTELRNKIEEQLTESYRHLGLVNRKISLLLELEDQSQSKENKQEIVEYILSSLLSLSHAKAGLLYLAIGKNHFNLISSAGLEIGKLSDMQIINENSADFIKQLTKTGKRVNSLCSLVDPGCFKDHLSISYFVALPILSGDICKGFIFLGFTDRKSMDVQDLEFLDVFAKHVSLALVGSGILSQGGSEQKKAI